jgi:two-component system phosphate regulon sensor histidine kinase PhoR
MFRRLFSAFAFLLLAPLIAVGLAVALTVPPAAGRDRVLGFVAAAAGLGVAAAGLAAGWAARRFCRPLRDLSEAADRLGRGEFEPHVFAPGRDALARLGRDFNRMSDRLAARIAQLEEDRQQLRTILSGMVEGVVALDAEQRILFANDRAHQLLEFPTRSPVGRRLWEVVRQRPLLDVVRRALQRPEPHREELAWHGATARSLTVHAARIPGEPARGAVLVVHDTSELRRLERLRQEFVANVSHELKTPLSVIKVCVETLLDGAADDPTHRGRFLEQIAGQAERLHALILDLLSLARIESGAELFEFRALPVAETLRAALERHHTRAESRRQTLCLTCPPGDGARETPSGDGAVAVWADEEAVDQILDNLLDNAVKYTPEGGQITVAWQADEQEVAIEVRDSGCGIPAADLPRIFERFYRVDKARSREMGGTGLGLSIVKHLVGALHGSVRATSEPGKGTTFIVCLPRAAPD